MKPSAITRRQVAALEEFASGFEWLVANSSNRQYEEFSFYRSPDVPDDEWNPEKRRTGVAAGRAAEAYRRFGQVERPNPLTDWPTSLTTPEEFDPYAVQSAIDSALGAARHALDVELARERGVTGLFATFIRWPQSLREAVGGTERQQRAASVLGIGGQVVAGLIVAGILWLVAQGASQVFG